MGKRSVVISGGGTGGHIYPAIGIAQALKRLDADIDIVFIGGKERLEAQLVPQHGFPFLPITVAGFPRRLTLKWVPVMWKALRGVLQSLRYIKQLNPDVVVGTGGYVSGPVLFAGVLRKIPIAIQEQNATAGLTNRILARWAKAAYLALAPAAAKFPQEIVKVTGNPIRPAIPAYERDGATYQKYGLCAERKTVLVMGGSQGAHAINAAVMDALPRLAQLHASIQFVHQTGEADAAAVQAAYGETDFVHRVQPFFDTVEEVYSIADVMVCRAGGMTVSEVTACGIPAIFIPLPAQTGNNQVLNAYTVADAGAAIVLEQGAFTIDELVKHLTHITMDAQVHQQMVTASRAIGKPHASEEIALSVISVFCQSHANG